jgi:hypothetical protein
LFLTLFQQSASRQEEKEMTAETLAFSANVCMRKEKELKTTPRMGQPPNVGKPSQSVENFFAKIGEQNKENTAETSSKYVITDTGLSAADEMNSVSEQHEPSESLYLFNQNHVMHIHHVRKKKD